MRNPEMVGRGFEPETLRRMGEVFGGKGCCLCPAATVRLYGGQFFCLTHYPRIARRPRPPRVYRCRAAVNR